MEYLLMPSMNVQGRYRGLSDVSQRHNGTYVGYITSEGDSVTPYRVNGIDGTDSNPRLILSPVRANDNSRTVGITDDRLVLDRPKLGMVNDQCTRSGKTIAFWFASYPGRQYKRSLDFNIIRASLVYEQVQFLVNVRSDSTRRRRKAVETFFNKVYPTYTEALAQMTEGRAVSIAFSEKFALTLHETQGIALCYKNTVVGWISDTGLPELHSNFDYLQEQLEDYTNADA